MSSPSVNDVLDQFLDFLPRPLPELGHTGFTRLVENGGILKMGGTMGAEVDPLEVRLILPVDGDPHQPPDAFLFQYVPVGVDKLAWFVAKSPQGGRVQGLCTDEARLESEVPVPVLKAALEQLRTRYGRR